MDKPFELTAAPAPATAPAQRPWDARLAKRLVAPFKHTWLTPNHLTTVRLLVGLAGAWALTRGTYVWSNAGAFLVALSNFIDHADGELARLSGKGSRVGHLYDLASDALVTVLLFIAMGAGISAAANHPVSIDGMSPQLAGTLAGCAVACIFMLRMRIESIAGKAGTRQASVAGFETEDVLYLLPLITLCSGVQGFLKLAAVGAPLFAIWVIIDYGRTLQRFSRVPEPMPAATAMPTGMAAPAGLEVQMDEGLPDPGTALTAPDASELRPQFVEQGAFTRVTSFVNPALAQQLRAVAEATASMVNRNYLPGHKQGGSVSRHTLEQHAPLVGQLYRSPALIGWLSTVCAERLMVAPDTDPHAFALYFYTRQGDHIGWHYDNSYYAGRRYTMLLGIVDDSSCRLEYELHTRDPDRAVQSGSVRLEAGDMVFFDGDRLRHRITPARAGETRISLTLEYVTDPRMHPWWRFISNMKDAIAYFGFRQVFRRALFRTPR
jgi:phosphatidylglycerophosphate synthase/alkylated DNA repair dioxygenase AlkB